MSSVLKLPAALSAHDIHALLAENNTQLNRLENVELSIANSIWCDHSFELRRPYVSTLQQYYHRNLYSVDFGRPEAARAAINRWAEEQTKSKIHHLLPDGSIDRLTRLVLANAIYFNGGWATEFPVTNTRDRDFILPDERTVQVPTMHLGSAQLPYAQFDEDGLDVLQLPYRGGKLSMFVLLPRADRRVEQLEQSLSAGNLSLWTDNLPTATVNVQLPKFKLRSEIGLKSILQQMGMVAPFSPEANFMGMSSDAKDLYISEVFHQATCEVSEQGTEASAASGVVIKKRAAFSFTSFHANRPFLFLIRDTSTGTVLFLGRVMNPAI